MGNGYKSIKRAISDISEQHERLDRGLDVLLDIQLEQAIWIRAMVRLGRWERIDLKNPGIEREVDNIWEEIRESGLTKETFLRDREKFFPWEGTRPMIPRERKRIKPREKLLRYKVLKNVFDIRGKLEEFSLRLEVLAAAMKELDPRWEKLLEKHQQRLIAEYGSSLEQHRKDHDEFLRKVREQWDITEE